ncbi:MAG: TlyA family RNA methyltransferase [Sulfurimonas sp.]|nr:MAG: TlyA family RNA methyltransferase [Sulfurimonas sp.]
MRLDRYLVEQGLASSRNQAQTLIKEGHVCVDAKRVHKASFRIDHAEVSVDAIRMYVSRSAMKLKHFLSQLPVKIEGMKVLDIGASTGGFTEVLLEYGAAHVDAVDVGSAQLHEHLRRHKRVTSIEQTDIRQFTCNTPYDLIVSDVSFISVLKIFEAIERLSRQWIIILFKPQFEVGRNVKRDAYGVISDAKAVAKAMQRFEDACMLQGWQLIAKEEAHITGKEGNREYCYCYRKH